MVAARHQLKQHHQKAKEAWDRCKSTANTALNFRLAVEPQDPVDGLEKLCTEVIHRQQHIAAEIQQVGERMQQEVEACQQQAAELQAAQATASAASTIFSQWPSYFSNASNLRSMSSGMYARALLPPLPLPLRKFIFSALRSAKCSFLFSAIKCTSIPFE